jgi:hypothetical protein
MDRSAGVKNHALVGESGNKNLHSTSIRDRAENGKEAHKPKCRSYNKCHNPSDDHEPIKE